MITPLALGAVRSEVGTLRSVLVHRPGRELDRLTPRNANELLFDDVIWPELARREHDALTAVLREAGVEVVFLGDLLAGACGISPTTAEALIAGDEEGPPLPNMMFVRDTSTWLDGELVLGARANPARRGEAELVARAYAGHPDLAEPACLAPVEGAVEIEGGDVFCLGRGAVLVGVGARTTTAAVEALAARLFATGFERVLAVAVPSARASIHLDCLMTMVDSDLLLIDPRLRGRGVVEGGRLRAQRADERGAGGGRGRGPDRARRGAQPGPRRAALPHLSAVARSGRGCLTPDDAALRRGGRDLPRPPRVPLSDERAIPT